MFWMDWKKHYGSIIMVSLSAEIFKEKYFLIKYYFSKHKGFVIYYYGTFSYLYRSLFLKKISTFLIIYKKNFRYNISVCNFTNWIRKNFYFRKLKLRFNINFINFLKCKNFLNRFISCIYYLNKKERMLCTIF